MYVLNVVHIYSYSYKYFSVCVCSLYIVRNSREFGLGLLRWKLSGLANELHSYELDYCTHFFVVIVISVYIFMKGYVCDIDFG